MNEVNDRRQGQTGYRPSASAARTLDHLSAKEVQTIDWMVSRTSSISSAQPVMSVSAHS